MGQSWPSRHFSPTRLRPKTGMGIYCNTRKQNTHEKKFNKDEGNVTYTSRFTASCCTVATYSSFDSFLLEYTLNAYQMRNFLVTLWRVTNLHRHCSAIGEPDTWFFLFNQSESANQKKKKKNQQVRRYWSDGSIDSSSNSFNIRYVYIKKDPEKG